jgi:hypothetical protein
VIGSAPCVNVDPRYSLSIVGIRSPNANGHQTCPTHPFAKIPVLCIFISINVAGILRVSGSGPGQFSFRTALQATFIILDLCVGLMRADVDLNVVRPLRYLVCARTSLPTRDCSLFPSPLTPEEKAARK